MKKIFFVFSFLTVWNISNAQFKLPSEEEVAEVKQKTLLVVFPDADNADEEYVKQSNEWLKEIVGQSWKFTGKVEYVTASQAASMKEAKGSNYVILEQGKSSRLKRTGSQTMVKYEVWEYRMMLQNEKGKWKEIFSEAYFSRNLGYSDIVFAISQCQLYFESVAEGKKKKEIVSYEKNITVLNTKTVYLTEDMIKGDKENIIEGYKGKVVFVSADELEKKIFDREKDCLFITYLFSDQQNTDVYLIVDAETMQVRGISNPGGIAVTFYTSLSNSPSNWRSASGITFRSSMKVGKGVLNTFFNKTAQSLNNGM